jgi:hypothetical protein
VGHVGNAPCLSFHSFFNSGKLGFTGGDLIFEFLTFFNEGVPLILI